MARIFSVLAVLALALLAANFFVGLFGGDFNAAVRTMREAQKVHSDALRRQPTSGGAPSPELAGTINQALTAADSAYQPARSAMTLHMLLGSAAAMIAVLVHSIAITYFIGTSRWCKEVCDTYSLPTELAERSTRLKRNTFPWALAGILSIIIVIALGAAADPTAANRANSAQFVLPHYVAAIVGLLIVAIAFWVEISRIAENYAVIDEILSLVQKARAEQGLPSEELTAP